MQSLVRLLGPTWLFSFLLGWLSSGEVSAQQAPGWRFAIQCPAFVNSVSSVESIATDANGNVFVTGTFGGQVSFGNTTLVSTGNLDMYLAKWEAVTSTWVWAVSGGSTGDDRGTKVAVSGNNVYVTGVFSSNANAIIAGTNLPGAGISDMFVAKYIDNGTSMSNGWAVSGGGLGLDDGMGLAVEGANVYVTGTYAVTGNVTIAGTSLSGVGNHDVYVAKYIDGGTTVRNGWATSGGGTGYDLGYGVAVRDSTLYMTGFFRSSTNTVIAGTSLPGAGDWDMFVARYVDQGATCRQGGAVSSGGTGYDGGIDITVNGPNVYVTGFFDSNANAVIAGTSLPGAGKRDMFLAKYVDTGLGLANGWGTSGGGGESDQGHAVAVSGGQVLVTGQFASFTNATIAGTAITGAGLQDVFLAKYVDAGQSATNGWVATPGGALGDGGAGIALSGSVIYVVGRAVPVATFGSHSLSSPTNAVSFLAGLTDLSVGLTEETASTATPFTLSPNPAHHTVRLTNAPAATAEVVDALGRTVRTADLAPLTADLSLQGLPPGLYVVRCGAATRRLVVE